MRLMFDRYQDISRSNAKKLLQLAIAHKHRDYRRAMGIMRGRVVFQKWMRKFGPNRKQHQLSSNSLPPNPCTARHHQSGRRCIKVVTKLPWLSAVTDI